VHQPGKKDLLQCCVLLVNAEYTCIARISGANEHDFLNVQGKLIAVKISDFS
jgi:hypothetical protein